MTDPRLAIISKRLEKVSNIIAVSSGKGGVGKSIIATSLALNLLNEGNKVGLLDLDFTSPSTHVILGVKGLFPKEEYGIIPPLAYGLKYMSMIYYSVDEPTPLRGEDVSNAIIELMAITRWEELDHLVIDMPPGIGDATLDVIRLIPGIQFLLITTPSQVAYQSVKRLTLLLKELKIPILGVIENMVITKTDYVSKQLKKIKIKYINSILFDFELENAIGFPEKFMKTRLHNTLSKLTGKII
jgi:ATP-binding protein involved in chromosome partitioning